MFFISQRLVLAHRADHSALYSPSCVVFTDSPPRFLPEPQVKSWKH